ncbi:DEAD box protein 1 [Intoshia linei]|uniref:ATP-dependent RNA helicase DDX1 n=1 Tax=Intoshia linei TaxID=1819745 RepID=A0A177AZH7_9BILA|nr:DEAD box protein 1 [Intoshia linei]
MVLIRSTLDSSPAINDKLFKYRIIAHRIVIFDIQAFCLPAIQIVHETIRDDGKTVKITTPNPKFNFSMIDKHSNIAVDANAKVIQCRLPKSWAGIRTNMGVRLKGIFIKSITEIHILNYLENRIKSYLGKYYFEITINDSGLSRIGISTNRAVLELGTDSFGYGYGATGKKVCNRQYLDYGEAFVKNDIMGIFIDLDDKEIAFSKNGKYFGCAFLIKISHVQDGIFPTVTLKNAEVTAKFDGNFTHDPNSDGRSGFIAIGKADNEFMISNDRTNVQSTKNRSNSSPLCLIVAPFRELAEQISAEMKKFSCKLPEPKLRIISLIGGCNESDAETALQKIGVDVVIATPGRLDAFISRDKITLSFCRFFILDEADAMFSDFAKMSLVKKCLDKIPVMTKSLNRQLIVSSATLHNFEVKKFAESNMHFPTWIDLKGKDSVPDTIHQLIVKIDPVKLLPSIANCQIDGVHDRETFNINSTAKEALSKKIKYLKLEATITLIKRFKLEKAIIFCRTRVDCDNMNSFLNDHFRTHNLNLKSFALHSGKANMERNVNLKNFTTGQTNFLVCTDVAARGIDIKELPCVLNVTLPDEKQNYLHRIGRVGRADRIGIAISLVAQEKEKVWYHKCMNRGRNCQNTRLVDQGGCCIWYDELSLLSEIEEHIGETISFIQDFNSKLPLMGELDETISKSNCNIKYGEILKREELHESGDNLKREEISSALYELSHLEKEAQLFYFNFLV